MVGLYCEFRKINPHLTKLDIGGGLPFQSSLDFEFEYEYVITEIVNTIKEVFQTPSVQTRTKG